MSSARPWETAIRLLDLFCGAGGASAGYVRAGFEVVGVDIVRQKKYPFEFYQADALEFLSQHGHEFDVIHASPPCFVHSQLARMLPEGHGHVDMIPDTRSVLVELGRPWVIENVEWSTLQNPMTLCGSMFGLGTVCGDGVYRQLRRHRWFESSATLTPPGPCDHTAPSVGVYGGGPQKRAPRAIEGRGGYRGTQVERMAAMGIDWMTRRPLNLAIPPAYTEHVGTQILRSR